MAVTISSPSTFSHQAVAGGTIHVLGSSDPGDDPVWVKIDRATYVPPPAGTNAGTLAGLGYQAAARQSDGTYHLAAVPGTVTVPLVGDGNNLVVAIPQLASGLTGDPVTRLFVGRPEIEHLAVDARSCLWFAYAGAMLRGPCPLSSDQEPDTDEHRPPMVKRPENVGLLTTATSGTWRHFPPDPVAGDTAASNADGMGDPITLEEMGYQNAYYQSDQIANVACPVNRLIGMWADGTTVPLGDPFSVGVASAHVIHTNATRLFLAFHDGKRWHNNSWAVNTTLTWGQLNLVMLKQRILEQMQQP